MFTIFQGSLALKSAMQLFFAVVWNNNGNVDRAPDYSYRLEKPMFRAHFFWRFWEPTDQQTHILGLKMMQTQVICDCGTAVRINKILEMWKWLQLAKFEKWPFEIWLYLLIANIYQFQTYWPQINKLSRCQSRITM